MTPLASTPDGRCGIAQSTASEKLKSVCGSPDLLT
jgi:hypothetical protein